MLAASALLISVLFSAQPAASQTLPGPRLISTLRPLTDVEITKLLTDTSTGPECCDMEEIFSKNGKYLLLGRGPIPGTWAVRGNAVCVITGGAPESCRRLFSDEEGRTYIASSDTTKILAGFFEVRPSMPGAAP
jgi:hypothetical protein